MRQTTSSRLQVLAELNPDVIVDLGSSGDVSFGQVETEVPETVLTLGSSGAITAVAAKRMGVDEVRIAGSLGRDVAGDLVRSALADENVQMDDVVLRDNAPTGVTTVLLRPDGDRALLTSVGAMSSTSYADLDLDRFAQADHLHVSSIFLQRGMHAGLADLFDWMHEHDATCSIDPGWASDGNWSIVSELLPRLDLLLPNESEVRQLVPEARSTLEAARRLAAQGPTVAVKCGARGAVVVVADKAWCVEVDPVDPVDTTGAGDNFNAGYLAAMLQGSAPWEALCHGAAAGSHAVLARGGTGSVITPENLHIQASALMSRLTPINEESQW